ncbi:MAG: type 1 glutamine amidotransferase [Thermodesulfobacteriaceae bacterium]|nr:type 1 glutamine amidotransferase [Caldimicrobium sp.]MCX8041510.1 type 1 glutamine amidotransferase [Thermodesulfobacteriaceae bacterium]MDW8135482.1 type 1 glutamine amidotransferase domain-containing protein [Thermodesulfobacterium sp.]
MKALIISYNNFEDSELLYPLYRLIEEGFSVDIASLKRDKIKGKHGYVIEANLSVEEVRPEVYDLLILPGGKAPEALRKNEGVLKIVQTFYESGKIIGAICHGPQILISAGILKGKRATSYKSVAKEILEASAIYEDKAVVIDGNIITSRSPLDLPYFMKTILELWKATPK